MKLKKKLARLYNHYLVSIRSYVKDKPSLGCFLKIILRGSTKEFQEYVSRYVPTKNVNGKEYRTRYLKVLSMGELNANKLVVYLERDSGSGGFCAEWIFWLNRLAFADSIGACFCIHWTWSQFYKEKEIVNGTNNIFEYYFLQPCNISVNEATSSKNVILDANIPDYGYYDLFAPGRVDDYQIQLSDIKALGRIQKKYIRLNDELNQELIRNINEVIGNQKVLAVHARGADANIPYNNHPTPVRIDDYIKMAKLERARINADKIFLATDDNNILKAFVAEFGDNLVYYSDVERSDGVRMNCYGDIDRPMHHYRLGWEIIRDVYTMSNCHGFVGSNSYVSYMVQIVKFSMEQEFESLCCIQTPFRSRGWNLTDPNTVRKVEEIWNKELESRESE